MYPGALDCGMSAESFWDSTPLEIMDVIESHQRKTRQAQTIKIEQLFVLAEAIGSRIAYLFSEQKDTSIVMQPWDAYPQLFAEEKRLAEQSEEERQLEAYKEARRQHAARFNQMRREAES